MIDEALVPGGAMFDYSHSITQSPALTTDGALDGISHALNPYYVVFFSPVVGERLKKIVSIYKKAGYIKSDIESLEGRELRLTGSGRKRKYEPDRRI